MADTKAFVTFGQEHVHKIKGKTFDRNCVAVVRGQDHAACREKTFKAFGREFHNCYKLNDFTRDEATIMSYFPRGLIET